MNVSATVMYCMAATTTSGAEEPAGAAREGEPRARELRPLNPHGPFSRIPLIPYAVNNGALTLFCTLKTFIPDRLYDCSKQYIFSVIFIVHA